LARNITFNPKFCLKVTHVKVTQSDVAVMEHASHGLSAIAELVVKIVWLID